MGRGLVWPVGVADVVVRAEGCCWVGRMEQGLKLAGSRRWSMRRDRGGVLRYAQDDRLRRAGRIVPSLNWGGLEKVHGPRRVRLRG
jgi:hypothetical protein